MRKILYVLEDPVRRQDFVKIKGISQEKAFPRRLVSPPIVQITASGLQG